MDRTREQFEEWFDSECDFITNSASKGSAAWIKHGFWTAWQASRAAIEVEFPEKISEHNKNENGYVLPDASSYDEAIDDCAEGVIAAGIGIKLRNSYD